jgi:hypothetical protein
VHALLCWLHYSVSDSHKSVLLWPTALTKSCPNGRIIDISGW